MATILYKWLLLSFFFSSGLNNHPYYVSVVELRNNSSGKMAEITCRLFTDDLEKALKNDGAGKIDLMHPVDKSDAEKKIFSYLKKHFSVSINQQKRVFDFVGYEIKEEAVNVYLEFPFNGKFQNIHLTSDLLYREHAEQSGIFHFIDGDKKESRRIINPQNELDVVF